MRFPIILASLLVAGAAAADDSELRLVQKVINDSRERCDAVVNLRAGARVDNGDVLVVVDCSDGSSHVVRLAEGNRVSYYMNCEAWANPVDC